MSRRWEPRPRRPPPWWPEDQAWPPARGWRRGPPPFVWRLGCLVVMMFAIAAVGASLAVGWLASRFGPLPVGTFVAVFVVAALLVAGRGMRRFTQPMDDLIEAAGRIEHGDYSAHVAEHGPPQLRSVARAFNSMSARLQASDDQRRTFLADVVHELRTPLAVIRGQAEGIADGVFAADADHLEAIVEATRSLEVLVEDLRALALADAGNLVMNREAVDVAVLVHDVLASFDTQAQSAGITVGSEVSDGLPLADIDPVRVRSALGNLISNAIRHTPRGGMVRIAVAAVGNQIEIIVADTGEGISPDLLPHVFERFVRGPASKGSGLGLAIVHDIVVAHGGSIGIDSKPGTGTTVRITLPGVATSA